MPRWRFRTVSTLDCLLRLNSLTLDDKNIRTISLCLLLSLTSNFSLAILWLFKDVFVAPHKIIVPNAFVSFVFFFWRLFIICFKHGCLDAQRFNCFRAWEDPLWFQPQEIKQPFDPMNVDAWWSSSPTWRTDATTLLWIMYILLHVLWTLDLNLSNCRRNSLFCSRPSFSLTKIKERLVRFKNNFIFLECIPSNIKMSRQSQHYFFLHDNLWSTLTIKFIMVQA